MAEQDLNSRDSAPNMELTFFDILAQIRKRMKRLALASILIGVVSSASSWLIDPYYKATVLLTEAEVDSGGSLLSSISLAAGVNASNLGIGGNSRTELALTTMTSRTFLTEFIIEDGIEHDLLGRTWDFESRSPKSLVAAIPNLFGVEFDPPDLYNAYEILLERIRIDHDILRKRLYLTITWNDPEDAANWANGLANRLNLKLRAESIDIVRRKIDNLTSQALSEAQAEIQRGLFDMIRIESGRLAALNAQEAYAFRVIDNAVPPREKSGPSFVIYLLVGLFGTFITYSGIIILGANLNIYGRKST